MIIKLLPENITKNWDTISFAINEALPPVAGEALDKNNRILEALLTGMLECWIMYKYEEDGIKIQAIATTQLLHENISNVYNLLMYSLYAFRPITEDEWVDGYQTLIDYAKSVNCNSIISYTEDPRLLALADRLGAGTSTRFVKINI